MNKTALSFFKPVFILFAAVTILILVFSNQLDRININHNVLLFANLLLLVLTFITGLMHIKASRNNNAYAFVRSITLSTFLKLIVIAASVIIYLNINSENKSIYALAVAMFLYLMYTIIEVRGAMTLNRSKQ